MRQKAASSLAGPSGPPERGRQRYLRHETALVYGLTRHSPILHDGLLRRRQRAKVVRRYRSPDHESGKMCRPGSVAVTLADVVGTRLFRNKASAHNLACVGAGPAGDPADATAGVLLGVTMKPASILLLSFMKGLRIICTSVIMKYSGCSWGGQTVRDKCFEKCITRPSSSLGSSDQQCLARCADRYAEVRYVAFS